MVELADRQLNYTKHRAVSEWSLDMAEEGSLKHIADCYMLFSHAMELEGSGEILMAIKLYQDSLAAVEHAMFLGRALLNLNEPDSPVAMDMEALEEFKAQVVDRMEWLCTLSPGRVPLVPPEEHVTAPALQLVI